MCKKKRLNYLVILLAIFKQMFWETESQEDYYRHFPSSIPNFLPVPTNITVHQGETAQLRCRIQNLGPKTVVWRRTDDDFPLTVGKRAFTPNKNIEVETEEISDTENTYDLVIKDVQEKDAGIYECQISSTNIYTMNITLNVLDPVEYKPELNLYGTEYVSLMEDIHLICNATGSIKAPDGVDWFFNGDVISESNSLWHDRLVNINKKPLPGRSLISELIIKRATMEDRGHYVCRLTKKLAQGFKVHVLNDRKNHKEPKRDMKPENEDAADSLASISDRSTATVCRAFHTFTLASFLITVIVFR